MDPPEALRPQTDAEGSPSGGGPPAKTSSVLRVLPAVPTIPDYDLLRRIGGGAYGEVWLARSKATGALRAAKIVWRHTFQDERPFRREFEGIQHFEQISREHPSQLALFHIGRNDPEGYFYYVMELADDAGEGRKAEGTRQNEGAVRSASTVSSSNLHPSTFERYIPHTLRAELERGRLPASRVLEIGLALAEALSHLHRNGLVHRDVKPSNVIFVKGRPKLADIGLVTDASDQCSIVGTEGYLPPEGPGTPQADIFALGKVLYEAATGVGRREFPKLPDDLRTWPDAEQIFELNEIIIRACESDSNSRYQRCEEMQGDLELLQRGQSVRRKRALGQYWAVVKRALVTAAIVGLIGMGGLVLWRQSRAIRPLSANPEALRLYDQAVYERKAGTLERYQQAYTNLVEAVRLDPRFVDAYYMMLEVYFGAGDKLPPHFDSAANIRELRENMLKVSPNSAQFHTVNSWIKFNDWKFEEAIREVSLAMTIDPKFLRSHGLYAYYVLQAHGDADTALREYRIAEQIEGSDVIIQNVLGDVFCAKRDFTNAIEQYEKAIRLEDRSSGPYLGLYNAYEASGQYDKAIDKREKWDLLIGLDPEKTKAWHQRMRSILHEKGPRGWWQAQVDGARESPHPDPYWMAELNARLENTNEVLSLLEQAYQEHNDDMPGLLTNYRFDHFHGDPRFQQLLKRMGFRPKSAP